MIQAYSYIRFSTPEQYKGDSFRRQMEAAESYAEEQDLALQDFCYKDLGVSGFKGSNLKTGALGQFKAQVESGVIPLNSWLLIEAWDRFSRMQPKDALRQMLDMLELGITIVTLVDGQIYHEDDLQIDKLLLCLIFMSRANEESEIKSKRVAAAADKRVELAREKGIRISKVCPKWMKPAKNGGFELIPEKAKVVQMIFDLTIAGYGRRAVTRRLTEMDIKPFSARARAWHVTYIDKMVKSPAVYGDYQPKKGRGASSTPHGDPIEGYYPAVVTKEIALAAQHKSRERDLIKDRGVSRAHKTQYFLGMIYCSCGDKLVKRNNGDGMYYYRCINRFEVRGCTGRTLKANVADDMLLSSLAQFGYETLLSPEVHVNNDVELSALKESLDKTSKAVQVALRRLLTMDSDALADRLTQLEREEGELKDRIKTLERAGAANSISTRSNQDVEDMLEQVSDIVDGDDEHRKTELALWLKSVIDRIVFVGEGAEIHLKHNMPKYFEDEEDRNVLHVYRLDRDGFEWKADNLTMKFEDSVYTKYRKPNKAKEDV